MMKILKMLLLLLNVNTVVSEMMCSIYKVGKDAAMFQLHSQPIRWQEITATATEIEKPNNLIKEIYTNVSIPLLPTSEIFIKLHETLQYDFKQFCMQYIQVSNHWKVDDCISDLNNQVIEWVKDNCENKEYLPNQYDNCHKVLKDEIMPPTLSSIDSNPLWKRLLPHILQRRKESAWIVYYKDVVSFINHHFYSASLTTESTAENVTIVEIGSMYGGLVDFVAGEIRNAHVYAVDPFLGGYDDLDPISEIQTYWAEALNLTSSEFANMWALAISSEQHKRHGCRHHQIKTTSLQAASSFDDSSVDVVFIDGLHTYEGVATDIMAWERKLKKTKGFFIFNDFKAPDFPGVTRAVEDYVTANGYEMTLGSFGVPPGSGNVAVRVH